MDRMTGYNSQTQTDKNIAWMLPRPKPDRYKGGMPLYCEDWLVALSKDIMGVSSLDILNVFCGMNKHGIRVDLNPEVNPDINCDIHKLTEKYNEIITHQKRINKLALFDIIIADPPYSDEETDQLYGKHLPRLNYTKWTGECDKFLRNGGLFIVYHKFLVPNPNPEYYEVVKRVAVFNRVWHLPRVAVIFRKHGGGSNE
jgi:hypothetical protein